MSAQFGGRLIRGHLPPAPHYQLGRQSLPQARPQSTRRREDEAANRKRSTRSFNLKWAEMDGWSKKYDVEQVAREIKPDDWALFLRVLDETKAFAEAVTLAKESGGTPES